MLQYNSKPTPPAVLVDPCAMQQAASHATALAIPAREEAGPAVFGAGEVPALLASVAIRPPASDRAERWVWAAALSLALMAHAAILFALAHKAADFMAGGGGPADRRHQRDPRQLRRARIARVGADAAGPCRRRGLGREHRRGPREHRRGSRGAARGEEGAAGGAEGEAQGRADPRGRSHHRGAAGSTDSRRSRRAPPRRPAATPRAAIPPATPRPARRQPRAPAPCANTPATWRRR